MSPFVRKSLFAVSFIIFAFSAVIFYASRQMPVMTKESKNVLDGYFQQVKAKNYNNAGQFLTPEIQAELTDVKLKAAWQKFEAKNGPFQKWIPSDSSSLNGGRVCLFPPYVDYLLRAYGTKGMQIFFMRVSPQNDGWKISQLREIRQ